MFVFKQKSEAFRTKRTPKRREYSTILPGGVYRRASVGGEISFRKPGFHSYLAETASLNFRIRPGRANSGTALPETARPVTTAPFPAAISTAISAAISGSILPITCQPFLAGTGKLFIPNVKGKLSRTNTGLQSSGISGELPP